MEPTVQERLETLEVQLRRLTARVGALDSQTESGDGTAVDAEAHDYATLAKLRQQGIDIPQADAWRQTIGWAKGLAEHHDAVQAGAAWRAEANQSC